MLDGVLCHNGETHDRCLAPEGEADWDSFAAKFHRIEAGGDALPLTAEGCVVRCADSISYLGRDLADALEVEVMDESELAAFPESCMAVFGIKRADKKEFSDINRVVLDVLIKDVITNSYDTDLIAFSEAASESIVAFKEFNRHKIYENERLVRNREKIRFMFRYLFEQIIEDLKDERKDSAVYSDFIDAPWVSSAYTATAKPAEAARDFIAGMTPTATLSGSSGTASSLSGSDRGTGDGKKNAGNESAGPLEAVEPSNMSRQIVPRRGEPSCRLGQNSEARQLYINAIRKSPKIRVLLRSSWGYIPAWGGLRIVSFPFHARLPTGNSPSLPAPPGDGGWQPVIPPEKVDRLEAGSLT